jgi:hypothetical protein
MSKGEVLYITLDKAVNREDPVRGRLLTFAQSGNRVILEPSTCRDPNLCNFLHSTTDETPQDSLCKTARDT